MPTDLDLLQGPWTVTALEMDGSPFPATGSLTITADRFEAQSMGAVYTGRMVINEETSPKSLDLYFADGPEAGNVNQCIYELENGRWRICLATRGDARPLEFRTSPGTGHALELLERGGELPPTEPQQDRASVPELEGDWLMVSGAMNGAHFPPQAAAEGRRSAYHGETRVSFGRQLILHAAYRVDKSAAPNRIDYTLLDGPNKGKQQFGIFKLDGENLHLSFAAPGQPRPDNFQPTPGDGKTVTVWRRA